MLQISAAKNFKNRSIYVKVVSKDQVGPYRDSVHYWVTGESNGSTAFIQHAAVHNSMTSATDNKLIRSTDNRSTNAGARDKT